MTQDAELFGTGLSGLDRILHGLIAGDNVIWQVESVDDYLPFVDAYCRFAALKAEKLVYIRFARHERLLPRDDGFETFELAPDEGPEMFVSKLHKIIELSGRGAWYVFDDLSDLAEAWCGDTNLANVFLLTCPYLYEMEAIAYFAFRPAAHSPVASSALLNTAQVILNVHRHNDRLYVQPIKVDKRHSSTMYMLHAWEGDRFLPVTSSTAATEILKAPSVPAGASLLHRSDIWDKSIDRAREIVGGAGASDAERDALFRRLLRMLVSHDEKVLELARTCLTLADLLEIADRLVGTGNVGGKAAGMLIARAILARGSPRWKDVLEAHDSFYIGSDVFFTFLVRNGIWWAHEKQRDPRRFLEDAEQARQRILMGAFPDDIMRQFQSMLDYFGQAPIIVRSSSLLEDNFSNAFAGKYESVFCANQGSREHRLHNFLSAVRSIYASAMSEKALTYRAQRGILDREEQMALLVQRVSGSMNGTLFYPHIAGVAFSHNPYVWCDAIDAKAGVLRLVFGLGTRAVDRTDDDYTRLVALNAPGRRPEDGKEDFPYRCQRRVDVLDLDVNRLASRDFSEVAAQSGELPIELFASRDDSPGRPSGASAAAKPFPWRLTFDQVLKETAFVEEMRSMLAAIQRAYDYPVDVEFTANFLADSRHKINVLQCRPLPVSGDRPVTEPPADILERDVLLRAQGAVIGPSRVIGVERIICVVPSAYGQLPIRDRYSIARLVGALTRLEGPAAARKVLLLGPGRWGTRSPDLGVPVSFGEISRVSALCEIVAMRDDLVPDVSLGTHFFSELVEADILYLALFPGRAANSFNVALLESLTNCLAALLPSADKWNHVVRVIDPAGLPVPRVLKLNANSLTQKVVCYFEPGGK